jgi:hypothetical protein
VTEGVTAAQDAEAASSWAALGPILLIIAAIAALVVIGYVIYRNWTTIWNAMKLAVKAVWDWIKNNWPLLVGILFGPIGIAAALIYKYWDQILRAAQAVWHWIATYWPLLVAIMTGPFGVAVLVIIRNWSTITGFFSGIFSWFARTWGTITGYITAPFSAAFSWISQKAGQVAGWFTGIPAAIGRTLSGVASAISGPFTSAFDAIARFWNSTVGTLSFHVPGWIPGVGGKGFDAPKIPVLAQGGLMTASGLIFAHAGEVISPAPAATRTGPVVVINNAHFSSKLDVEAFMRQVAWSLQKQAI